VAAQSIMQQGHDKRVRNLPVLDCLNTRI